MNGEICKISMEDSEIIDKVESLRNTKLIQGCHLHKRYKEFSNITIGEAAIKEVKEKQYGRDVNNRPAIALLEVIFSIHTDYTRFVEKAIDRLMKKSELKHFNDIKKKTNEFSKEDFLNYWNYYSEDKYEILIKMLNGIDELRLKYKEIKTDYELLHEWAKNVDITNITNDVFGRINGVAEATVQHLRMNFGIDTTKPDQQVVMVLEKEFNIKTNKIKAINYVKSISEITKYNMIELDQIFVNYGSGYYSTQKNLLKSTGKENALKLYQNVKKNLDLEHNKVITKERLLEKFEACVEIDKRYSFMEFYKLIQANVNLESKLFKLMTYLLSEIINDELINDDNLKFKRRGDENKASYIYEFNERKGNKGKNIFTMWLQNEGVRIHIPTYFNVPNGKLYNDIKDMKNDKVDEMLINRYRDMTKK